MRRQTRPFVCRRILMRHRYDTRLGISALSIFANRAVLFFIVFLRSGCQISDVVSSVISLFGVTN